ncbi:hypothetical protein ACQRB0_06060 [Paratractidigestivibacter faecalis]|uniref:hypothetical protein n=2 Tax=Paratractidigestivibacter faecalis TaxID=2292441 RepID=UPI003CFF0EF2
MKARAAEIATVTVLGTLSVAYCLFYYHLNDDGYSIYSGQLGFLHALVCVPVIRFSLAWIVGLVISEKVIGPGRLTKIHIVAIAAFALCIGCAFLIPYLPSSGGTVLLLTLKGWVNTWIPAVAGVIAGLTLRKGESHDSYTLTGTDADSSLSVRGYLTICYTVSSDGLSALLTRVRGYWTILDQSVSVTKASVRYGCTSLGVGYGQAGERVVDNNFSFGTGFRTYAPISASSIGANLELKLNHGSSNWTLVVDSTYVNNVPGVISLDE